MVFKNNSQMKLQIEHESLQKLNRNANVVEQGFDTFWAKRMIGTLSWKSKVI
jgi:hypothetical protein